MFIDGEIEGVVIRPLKYFSDARGWLTEVFREDELPAPAMMPAMGYVSMTRPGTARGPHEHVHQTDIFVFMSSDFMLVLWDRREGSPTFNHKMVRHCGEKNPCCAIVPPGVVHAYRNVGDTDGTVLNFPNQLFAGRGKKEPVDEIRYEHDPNTIYKVVE